MKVNVLMDKDKSVMACFKRKKFNLTTTVDPTDGGTITEGGKFNKGTIVEVEAIPNPDYEFDRWEGDIPGKWAGLGMGTFHGFDSYVDTILASGFEELRIDIPSYENTEWLASSKPAVISAIGKGAKVIWGVSAGGTLTDSNWSTFRQAVLDAAQWAQDNGVFEFQLGNELESQVDGTTLTVVQLIANLKSLATEVQAIFTSGNVSYTCWQHQIDSLDPWVAAGSLGDIDILACNIYKGGEYDPDYDLTYQNRIAQLITAFGVDHTYLTEFNVSYTNLEHYSEDEAVQAAALTEMINYIKASGMTRAIYFMWKDDGAATFGVMKADETYRQLWNSLLNSE